MILNVGTYCQRLEGEMNTGFRLPKHITGEHAEEIVDEIRKIEPGAQLEIHYTVWISSDKRDEVKRIIKRQTQ